MYPMDRSSTFRRVWGRYRGPGANQHAPLENNQQAALKLKEVQVKKRKLKKPRVKKRKTHDEGSTSAPSKKAKRGSE